MFVIGSCWIYPRPSRATRGKWRIPDGKVESDLGHNFGALKVVAPPVSIKERVGWAPYNKY
jgi:hypothetical protein